MISSIIPLAALAKLSAVPATTNKDFEVRQMENELRRRNITVTVETTKPAEHYVSLGEQAIPTLIPLLDDEREIVYEGSQEATYGNSYQYRVKDFAAFYISQIRNIPYEVHTDPKMRNEEIIKLRNFL